MVGLPLTLRGERGEQAKETLGFVSDLARLTDVPVETYDERFTTTLATRGQRTPSDRCGGRRPSARGISATARRLVLIACLVFAVGAVYYGVRNVLPDSSKPTPNPHGPMLTVVIPRGATAVTISDLLEQHGIVSDGTRFRNYVKAQNQGTDFHPGRYQFQAGTDYDVIIRKLNKGPVPQEVKLVIPEGYRITQIVDSLKAVGMSPKAYKAALARTPPPAGWGATSMEGFLFPATYIDQAAREAADPDRPAAGGVPGRVQPGRHEVRPLQEPDRLRRAEDRLDDRARGGQPPATGPRSQP